MERGCDEGAGEKIGEAEEGLGHTLRKGESTLRLRGPGFWG